MMKNLLSLLLLCVTAYPVCAQQDSLRLQGDGEMKLNPDALRELEMNFLWGTPKAVKKKSWMEFDNSLPSLPQAPTEKVRLTLRPYTTNTRYDWDPVYRKKIKVGKDTWRGNGFLAGVRKSLANYGKVTSPTGWDFMTPFTREFWNFKGRKRRRLTLEALRSYGDSIQVTWR